MKRWLIEKLGGYVDIDSAIEAIATTNDREARRKILTLAVKRLFNTIGPDDILRAQQDGTWLYQGKQLNKEIQKILAGQAKSFIDSDLWKILQVDIKHQANKKMYIEAEDHEAVGFGKMWMFTLDALRTRLTSMAEDSALYNNKAVRKR